MARKRRRRGGGSGWKKWVRRGASIGGSILGGVVVANPAIRAAQNAGGNFATFTDLVRFNYTGIDSTGTIHWEETAKGVTSVLGGVVLAKLIHWAGRSL